MNSSIMNVNKNNPTNEYPGYKDFNTICRFCFSKEDLHSIFTSTYSDMSVKKLLKMCANVNVFQNDGLPQNICSVCLGELVISFDFQTKCQTANQLLCSVFQNKEEAIKFIQIEPEVNLHIKEECSQVKEEVALVIEENAADIEENFSVIIENSSIKEEDTNFNSEVNFEESSGELRLKDTEQNEENYVIRAERNEEKSSPCRSKGKEMSDSKFSVKKNWPYRIRKVLITIDNTPDSKGMCYTCLKKFPTKSELFAHAKRLRHKIDPMVFGKKKSDECGTRIICKKCCKTFSFVSFSKHTCFSDVKNMDVDKSAEPTQMQCELCNEMLNLEEVGDHEKTCSFYLANSKIETIYGGYLKCIHCSETFNSKGDLKKHKDNVHLTCTICCKTWQSTSKLKLHMLTHTKEKPHVCKKCGKSFSQMQNLKRHIMTHTGERPYTCEICNKGFIQQITLKEHYKIHDGDRSGKRRNYIKLNPQTCEYCGRKFKVRKFYENHLKKDHPEKYVVIDGEPDDQEKFECEVCKKKFNSKIKLKHHVARHGEKTHLCPQCGKGFYTIWSCQLHQRTHTRITPYECETCGKKFGYQSSYEMHLRIHEGTRAFACKLCPKTFIQVGHLSTHVKSVHSDEKQFSCPFCKKRFALKGNLTVHMRIHTGETPYRCPVCNRGFYDSSSMKKHLKSQHEVQEDGDDIM